MNLDPRTPLTDEEVYLAYKAGIIDEIPSRVKPMTRYQAYLAMWCGQTLDRTPTQPYTREEAYVATLAGIPNVLPDKARTRLQAYYEHIIKGDTPIPDYPITREEYYLSVLTKVTSGPVNFEPNIRLETDAGKIFGLNIYGNLEQKKYTGKNLLKISANSIISNGLSSTASDDGLIKYSGKMTDVWSNITDLLDFPAPLPAGKYTFSIDHPRTHRIIFKYRFADNSFNETIANMTSTSTSNTFTTTQPIVAGYLYIAAANGSSLNDTVKAQLEIGDTATDYETYTGGYNNLFNEFSGLPINSPHGVTLSNQNGVLKLTGKPTVDWLPILVRENLLLADKTTYTVISYNGASPQLFAQVLAYKKDGSGADIFGSTSGKVFTFTTDSTKYSKYSMKLQLGGKSAYSEAVTIYNNFALFAGNYTLDNLPEYSPYNTGLATPRPQYPQVVKELSSGKIMVLGKNLLKIVNIPPSQSQTTISVIVNQDNSITTQGENKNFWGMNFTDDSACPRIGQGTKVTMSIDRPLPYKLILSCWANTGGPSFQFPLAIINAGSTSVTNVAQYTALSGHLLFSLSEIGKQINETFKVQLEYGDTATDFVPHESSEFTIPSGLNLYKLTDNIYDEVKLENGVAKLIKRVGKLELSGEESNLFLYKNTVSGTIGFSYGSQVDIFKQSKLIPDIICSHFNSTNEGDTWHGLLNSSGVSIFAGRENFPLSINKIVFWFSITDMQNLKITDLASFKNWLKAEKAKGTPVTVYYEMKTPTEEEITDPTILTELKKLMEMRTYQGVTNISITSTTGATPGLSIKYLPKGATDIK